VAVSQTPGKTKHFQTIFLTKKLCLIDCPGLVFPSLIASHEEMILNGLLPVDQMGDPLPPIQLMCERIPKKTFELLYGIILPKPADHEDPNRNPTAQELLQTYAFNRSFMRAGYGTPDESRAARVFIKDYLCGKLLFCHPPPGVALEKNASPDPTKIITSSVTQKAPPSLLFQNKKIQQLDKGNFRKNGRQYVADDQKFTGQTEVTIRTKSKFGENEFTRRKKFSD
jgi:large subunit GTPase 1